MSDEGHRSQTWTGGGDLHLDPRQLDEGVWKNSILCANCRRNFGEHCKAHLIPCCPGKCPAESAD